MSETKGRILALARERAEQATDHDDDTEQKIEVIHKILAQLGMECRCYRCRAKREAGATEGLEGAEKGSGDATLGAARLVRAWATDHGEQRLYHVSPPMGWGRDYVVVSAIEQPAETLIFTGDNDEADPITDLEELPGSLRGVCDHEAALRAAGYIVSSGDAT